MAADGGAAAGAGGADTGLRGGMAAGAGAAAAGGGGLEGAGLAVSSSAIMRRMEARISSIEGSCAFAGWLIAESLHPRAARWNPAPRRITHAREIYSDRRKYVMAVHERQRSLVDRHPSARIARAERRVIFRPECAR